ncbi:MAG: ABC transporter ATP-binding protein [Pseudomonadota bacterium]
MIRLRELRKHYTRDGAPRDVLDGVFLDVVAGTLCAVLGTSGAGKTTLLHILGGLDSAFSGEVEVAGVALRDRTEPELARYRRDTVGFMFQDFHLLDHLSALDNVLLAGRFDDTAVRQRLREHALHLLERVGLQSRTADAPSSLSGGERQRVALARALLRQPRVLLADEPTGNLDGETGARLLELLRETASTEGTVVLVATHDPSLARAADRCLRLHQGRLTEIENREVATP